MLAKKRFSDVQDVKFSSLVFNKYTHQRVLYFNLLKKKILCGTLLITLVLENAYFYYCDREHEIELCIIYLIICSQRLCKMNLLILVRAKV